MLEGSCEPTFLAVFALDDADECSRAMRAVERFVSVNRELCELIEAIQWERTAMNVEIAIGEMHRFELCDALLIYRESRRSFITWHTVTTQKQGPPLLGPAQPLTTAFVDALAESLSGGAKAEVPSRENSCQDGSHACLVDAAARAAHVL